MVTRELVQTLAKTLAPGQELGRLRSPLGWLFHEPVRVDLDGCFIGAADRSPGLDDQGIGDQLAKVLDLDAQVVVPAHLGELVDAVVAGGGNDLGTGGPYLLSLCPRGLQPPVAELRHGQRTATTAAAEVLRAAGDHLAEVHYGLPEDVARLVHDAAASGLITGVVIGDRLGVLGGVKLYPPAPDMLRGELDVAHHLDGQRLAVPALGFPAVDSVAVPTLSEDQRFGAQAGGLVELPRDDLLACSVVAVEEAVVGRVPGGAGQAPIRACGVAGLELGQEEQRVELDLPGVEAHEVLGVRLVDGNLEVGVAHRLLNLFLHPLGCLHEVLFADPHVVAALKMCIYGLLQTGRDPALGGEDGAGRAHDEPHVEAHGAAEVAAAAHGAGTEGDVVELVKLLCGRLLGMNPPGKQPAHPVILPLVEGAELFGLVGRGQGGIARGEVVVTGVKAEAATHAGLHVDGKLACELGFQYVHSRLAGIAIRLGSCCFGYHQLCLRRRAQFRHRHAAPAEKEAMVEAGERHVQVVRDLAPGNVDQEECGQPKVGGEAPVAFAEEPPNGRREVDGDDAYREVVVRGTEGAHFWPGQPAYCAQSTDEGADGEKGDKGVYHGIGQHPLGIGMNERGTDGNGYGNVKQRKLRIDSEVPAGALHAPGHQYGTEGEQDALARRALGRHLLQGLTERPEPEETRSVHEGKEGKSRYLHLVLEDLHEFIQGITSLYRHPCAG